MPAIKNKFDQHLVDKLKRSLERDASNGYAKEFEISIDGFKIVSRTQNLDDFDAYQTEIEDGSETLVITVYEWSNNNRNTKHIYDLRDEETLGAIELSLRNELDKVKEQLRQSESDKQRLQNECDELKANRFTLNGLNLAEFGSAIMEKLIERNAPKLLNGTTLSGLFGGDEPVLPQQVAEASFERQPLQGELTPDQQRHIANLAALEHELDKSQMAQTVKILQNFMQHPENIPTVLELLNIKP